MTENVFTRVKSYMKSQHFILNDCWLNECVEYRLSTNRQESYADLQKFVEEQFLLNDLRDTNNINGCLPVNLAEKKCIILSGKYTLQLLKLYDISVSKFRQLEKIKNVAIDNIEATNTEKPQAWEPTGKRMLQLFLTDGVQDILAIEYKPIRFLNDSLLPGLKVMIIGPVVCRRGVILLEETNITIRGGEVDDLLVPNALENVLAITLNMPLNPDPYNDDKNGQKKKPANEYEDDFDIDFEELERIERSEKDEPVLSRHENSLSNSHQNSQISGTQNANNQLRIPQNINEFPTDDEILFDDFDIQEIVSNSHKSTSNTAQQFHKSKPSTSANILDFPDDFDLADVDLELNECYDKSVSNCKNDIEGNTRGNKRSSKELSPLPSIQPKIRCAQSTPMISKINKKITDFIGNTSSEENLPPKICDYISEVKKEFLTDRPIYKTVRGKVLHIGKLTKKDMLWILDGTIGDDTGTLDVDFSSQFMEKILGFSVSEFSQKKKKIKTDPKLGDTLRKQMQDGQHKLQIMDCLMELELKKDKNPMVMSFTELSEDQKSDYNKRFRMVKSKMT